MENYKQIKTDLDQLRLTVEKSELWVEKNGGYGSVELSDGQNKEQAAEVRPLRAGEGGAPRVTGLSFFTPPGRQGRGLK